MSESDVETSPDVGVCSDGDVLTSEDERESEPKAPRASSIHVVAESDVDTDDDRLGFAVQASGALHCKPQGSKTTAAADPQFDAQGSELADMSTDSECQPCGTPATLRGGPCKTRKKTNKTRERFGEHARGKGAKGVSVQRCVAPL